MNLTPIECGLVRAQWPTPEYAPYAYLPTLHSGRVAISTTDPGVQVDTAADTANSSVEMKCGKTATTRPPKASIPV